MSELVPDQKHAGDNLNALRGEIDYIDRLLLDLVMRRTEITLGVTEQTLPQGLPVMNPERHHEVIQNYKDALPEDSLMTPEDAEALAGVVMSISRSSQERHRKRLGLQEN